MKISVTIGISFFFAQWSAFAVLFWIGCSSSVICFPLKTCFIHYSITINIFTSMTRTRIITILLTARGSGSRKRALFKAKEPYKRALLTAQGSGSRWILTRAPRRKRGRRKRGMRSRRRRRRRRHYPQQAYRPPSWSRFDSIRFDSIRSDSIRFDSIRSDSIRFDSIRFDEIIFD